MPLYIIEDSSDISIHKTNDYELRLFTEKLPLAHPLVIISTTANLV